MEESLDALPSADGAAEFVGNYRQAVQACEEVTVVLPGAGKASLDVREISFSDLGDDSFAARFGATEGELEGFELIQVGVQSDDVVIGMTFVGIDPSDAEALTRDALTKVEQELDTTGTT